MDRNGQETAPERPEEGLDQASVRDLIVQLATIEDGMRRSEEGCRRPDADLVKQAEAIVEELHHRAPAPGLHTGVGSRA